MRTIVHLWFAADLAITLLPPLHWAARGTAWFGVPAALVYLFGAGAAIAASVVVAYLADPACDAGTRAR